MVWQRVPPSGLLDMSTTLFRRPRRLCAGSMPPCRYDRPELHAAGSGPPGRHRVTASPRAGSLQRSRREAAPNGLPHNREGRRRAGHGALRRLGDTGPMTGSASRLPNRNPRRLPSCVSNSPDDRARRTHRARRTRSAMPVAALPPPRRSIRKRAFAAARRIIGREVVPKSGGYRQSGSPA